MSPNDTALAWAPAPLQQALQALLPGLQLQVVASVDSTNTRLLDRFRSGLHQPCLLVAEAQTHGRGRNGRVWQSAPGASLTFSLGLPCEPSDWSGLSLAVGAALADVIEPWPDAGAARLQLKWPNDLWLADAPGGWRKLGGILVETVMAGATRACVIGVGLNVLPRSEMQGLGSGYACVQEIEPALDAPALLARVAPALVQALQRFETEGLAAFAAAFARRDLLRGRTVISGPAAVPGREGGGAVLSTVSGTAEGVDAQGALLLRHAGAVLAISSGEVSVRPAAEPALAGAPGPRGGD